MNDHVLNSLDCLHIFGADQHDSLSSSRNINTESLLSVLHSSSGVSIFEHEMP